MPQIPQGIAPTDSTVRFGDAELDRDARELRVAGKRAPLGPRGIALLLMLLDGRDRPISKQELLDTVWHNVIVEENNLQVQISTIRRLLGAHAIATIPGRGYRFMLPVQSAALQDSVVARPTTADESGSTAVPMAAGNLQRTVPALYGRDQECAATLQMLRLHPLVSIVGAAGIGKTHLAIASARTLLADYPDGVWLVELAPLNEPRLLVATIARSLQIVLPELREPAEELAAALRGLGALLVIDNCEHLIEEVGTLVARLLRDAAGLRILATSQEPLKVSDEQVLRLGPLAVPATTSVVNPLDYGAVRLLVEKVRSQQSEFSLNADTLPAAVEICQRLDGLPLAIELAAARVPLLGVAGVREKLGERFRVLTGGSRFAPKRHQTLRAALDWSHGLLNDEEQAVYRRLGTFVGSFSLEAAQDLAQSQHIGPWSVLEHLGSLVDKSLVMADAQARPRYQMLESTREHALEQLSNSGETDPWIERHARVTQRSLEREIELRRTRALLAELGNVRSAYEWARGPAGDPVVAVALATLPSMVLAVNGAVQEASQRLLEVEGLIDDAMPRHLVAQYWQWYGRIGLDGRLPPLRCISAFKRAERMFVELGNSRHVHACRRHLAEAMLDADDLDGAAAALQRAHSMETPEWPLADRVRRLRVEGLLLACSDRIDEALRTSSLALEMAQGAAIDRYELVLLNDIARIHLDAGHAHEAAVQYRALADRAHRAPNAGLTLSTALVGLVAALTAEAKLVDATAVAVESLPIFRRSGILLASCDILALLMARRHLPELAARLLGASDRFRADCETPRDPNEERCREQARVYVFDSMSDDARVAWMAAGACMGEAEVIDAVVSSTLKGNVGRCAAQ